MLHSNWSTATGRAGRRPQLGQEAVWSKSYVAMATSPTHIHTQDEVMTGSLYDYYIVSKITLALFEDSGYELLHCV